MFLFILLLLLLLLYLTCCESFEVKAFSPFIFTLEPDVLSPRQLERCSSLYLQIFEIRVGASLQVDVVYMQVCVHVWIGHHSIYLIAKKSQNKREKDGRSWDTQEFPLQTLSHINRNKSSGGINWHRKCR